MSLPRYSEYKDSGVLWLGEVPAHWLVRRLGFYFEERREKVSDRDYEPLSVTKAGVVPQLETAAKTDDGDNRKKVCVGDFVINSRSDRKGSSGASQLDGSVSLINTVLRPVENTDIRFVHHLLRSVPFQEEFYRYGKGIVADLWSTNYSEMRNIVLAMPKRSEQTAIAFFLDRETAKIDALIAEQEKLLTLLAEKRQATISHAVTKGLNPDAPMKDSGVSWLGEVPAHWEQKRIKDCGCEIVDCKNRTPELHPDGDYFVVRTSCVKNGLFSSEEGYFTDEVNFIEWTKKGKPQAGDVLFTREAPTGEACLAPEGFDFCLGQRMMFIRPNREFLASKFLLYSIYSGLVRERIDSKSKGSTVGHLRVGEVGELPLLVPPVNEQQQIIEFLDSELEKLDALKADTELTIGLLKERRSALISAAVTGKIDVREAATC